MKTWKDIVADLLTTNLTVAELADKAGTSPQVVSEIRAGRSKEPRGMTAVRLHQLHSMRCGADVSSAPPAIGEVPSEPSSELRKAG